jgi:hypothetical protein
VSRSRGRTTLVVLALIVAAVGGVLAGMLWYQPASGQPAQPLPDPSATVTSTTPTAGVPTPSLPPTLSPTPTQPAAQDARPVISSISDEQWRRMVATGTWRPGCPVGRTDLRRLQIGYVDFDGDVRRGSIVAHRDSVVDLAEIFTALFDARFPIERMEPVERYGGDVVRSLRANNTSAYNCRKPGQINAPVTDSPHASGRAIDINPVQNPWKDPRCDCWMPGATYAEATSGPGIIRTRSLPVQLFKDRGWVWQNIKVPDYMHFDTGYPSRPRPSAAPTATG